jgi:hypothetical protein
MHLHAFAPPLLLLSSATPPIAQLLMARRPEGSSRGLCRTFHVQPPSRFGKARPYLASRQPVELRIPPSTHLLRESSQIQGFITRMKAEPSDQIAGDYCDLFSRWVKERQSHRGARWKCGSQKARRRSGSTSDQLITRPTDRGGGENSRSIPTMTHTIRQVYAHPLSDFSQAIADSEVSSARAGLTPLHVISGGCPVGLVQNAELRRLGLAIAARRCSRTLPSSPPAP